MVREKTKFAGVYSRQTKKGDTVFDFTYRIEGKKIWEKAGAASEGYTAKLAATVRAERIRSLRHGLELPKQRAKAPLFSMVWTRYSAWAEKNKARGGRDDVYRWNSHLKDRLENKRLSEISSFDLERLKSDLSKKGLSPASVKHCLVLIRQIYNKAKTWGLYKGDNPIQGIKMPSVQNQRTRFLSHEDASALLIELKKMKTPDLHDMALLSLHTGMRAGELFNLRGYDLDFQNDLVRIVDPKNKKTRHCYMTPSGKEMLQGRMPEKSSDLVFPDKNGKKMVAISQSFRKVIKKIGFNSGITDRRQMITFHSLRHSFASWLALQGESLITIRDLLGHRTTAMTERYSHLIADHKRNAVSRLAKGFDSAEKDPKRAKETP